MSALCLYDGPEALCTVNEIKLELELLLHSHSRAIVYDVSAYY